MKGKANTNGPTIQPTMVNGKITKWMVSVFSHGPMVELMRANIKMIKSMGMDYTNGKMEGYMMDIGQKEYKVVSENILTLKDR